MPLRVRVEQAVATVEFDNPPANALSSMVLAELGEALGRIAADAGVRAVVFTSTGHRAFLSGADISEFPALLAEPAAVRRHTEAAAELFGRVAELPQPTVAAVQAPALGGGFEFVLLCDFVVAATRARFALPEVGLGIIPGGGGTQRLPRRIGTTRAMDMVLLGTSLTAAEARDLGLVSCVVEAAELAATGSALARQLADRPSVAVRAAKRAIVNGADLPLPDALRVEAREFARASESDDSKEGTRAFLERRAPTFVHH